MNKKIAERDSGNYVNGVYTTKNGFSGSGLGCPKGTRVWETNKSAEGVIEPFYKVPKDFVPGETEEFRDITREVAPDIMPYYAISNYGRVLNMKSGQFIKPNYRPNGYEYLCLAADNCKYGQKKYTTHRLVMKTFDPKENMDELEVNHINFNKADNYVNKTMEDGSIQSNLEWVTPRENKIHSRNEFDPTVSSQDNKFTPFSNEEVDKIRELRNNEALTFKEIKEKYFPDRSVASIQSLCNNQTYRDSNYHPLSQDEIKAKRESLNASLYTHEYTPYRGPVLTDSAVKAIRVMSEKGVPQKEICSIYNISRSTVTDIVTGKTHKDLL